MEPRFVTLDEVLALHEKSIHRYGGTLGVRDKGGLEAAIFHPQNVFFYGAGDLFDMAAAYAYHIAEGQCFLDGNKRTAAGTALVFLKANGVSHRFQEMEVYDHLIGIAEKRFSKEDLAEYLRRSAKPESK